MSASLVALVEEGAMQKPSVACSVSRRAKKKRQKGKENKTELKRVTHTKSALAKVSSKKQSKYPISLCSQLLCYLEVKLGQDEARARRDNGTMRVRVSIRGDASGVCVNYR